MQPFYLQLIFMVLRCEGSEAYAGAAWPVGMCARRAERLADKQSVTGPLSHAGIEGHAYSSARDKVSHDETDEQHWWRLRMISHRSPSGLFARSHFPLHSRPSHISLPQCQVFTVLVCFTESHLVCSNISASLERCLRRDIFPLMRASRQCKRHLSLPAFIRTHLETHTHTQASKQLLDLDTLHCTVMSTDS